MTVAHIALTAVAVLATAIIYGTDAFCALVLRPALARVDDTALAAVSGMVHLYGDRRLAIPGAVGAISAAAATVAAVLDGSAATIALDLIAMVALLSWLPIYLRVNAPINRTMTEAAVAGRTLPDIRVLQQKWDSVITLRATLQGVAVGCLLLAAMI